MTDSAHYALHRPELDGALRRGEEKIAALMDKPLLRLEGGETLIAANSEHGYVYRLRQGWAGRVRELSDGRNQFILIFLPGDLFAVKSMFVTRHPDAVLALGPAVIEQIDQRKLAAAYAADPDIAFRCSWQVVEEERRLHSWVTGLGAGGAEERLALLLTDFRGRIALSTGAGPGLLSYTLPMTQEQIGDHLGISYVHVNRVIRSFREKSIATVRNRKVVIHNPRALARLAEPLLDAWERGRPEYVGVPPDHVEA